jgi:hypothetical protein
VTKRVKSLIIIALVLTLLPACGKTRPPATPQSPPPIVLEAPAEFTVLQRSTTALPGSNGKVVLTIDDITRDQVMATLSWEDGTPIVATRSLRQDDVVTFTAGDHAYKIKLKTLKNVLVGNDRATFQLRPAPAERVNALSETEKIEALILSLKQLVGATFIRNGKEHTLDDAISHMRNKWEWKKSEIKTADDFIRIAGSKSSTSGKAYIIAMPDGTEWQTGDWFRKQLALIEEAPGKAVDSEKK